MNTCRHPFRAKRLALLLLLPAALGIGAARAQLGVKLTQLRPTGVLGEVMERDWSAQLMYIDDFEDAIRLRFFFTWHRMEPRLAAIPIASYLYEDGVWTVFPGEQSYSKYDLYFLGAGADFAVLRLANEKLTLYPGFEAFFGTLSEAYRIRVATIKDEDFEGGQVLLGGGIRAGADYAWSKRLATFAEWGTNTYWVTETGRFTFNEIALGVRISF
jgi:hypothetical protein